MAGSRRFKQVDVFGATSCGGNPVAVVVDAEGMSEDEMRRLARWTNLSETTFVLPASVPGADYAVRIFTPDFEVPFAGHPTLGTAHAWIESAGRRERTDEVVQQCAAGLVRVRAHQGRLYFAAPALRRGGDVDDATLVEVCRSLGVGRADVEAAQWVDNGPGWVAVLLRDADAVLALRPGPLHGRLIGVAGPLPPGAPEALEVRAFFPNGTSTVEDPVTGSLNASLAQWLSAAGRVQVPYRARQGTAMGRHGLVHVERFDPGDDIWVGGDTVTVIDGVVQL